LNPEKKQLLITGFLDVAKASPDSIALEIGGNTYSYQGLKKQSIQIAHTILKQPENPYIAILAAKSLTACTAILGTLMAGKAYLPLNKKNPVQRSQVMMKEAAANVIIAGQENIEYLKEFLADSIKKIHVILPDVSAISKLNEEFPIHHFVFAEEVEALPIDELIIDNPTDSIAYLLFTSGSTGIPKGVPVSNKSAYDYINFICNTFHFSSKDIFSQTFDLTFDLSVHDLFVCWNVGACLSIPPDFDSPVLLANYLRNNNITVWFSVPSVALMFQKVRALQPKSLSNLRYSFFCGEALTEAVVKSWALAASNSIIINLYGPTEATIAISYYEWEKDGVVQCLNGIVPVGKVFDYQEYMLADEDFNKVNQGEIGALLLHGSQVFKGYLNAPENQNPFIFLDGKNWFKTGDLMLEDEHKILHFMGRVDNQVKINGYRVELQEIDHVVRTLSGVPNLATVFDKVSNSLVTFIEMVENTKPADNVLVACRDFLPAYMIPSRIIYLPKMPLNNNGKIDRNYLLNSLHA
jgi:D-alanine--poly(phosphoribitol) ligase subunit 1